jgi:hypothetical protein
MNGIVTSLIGHQVKLSAELRLGSGRVIPKGTRGKVLEEWSRDGRMMYTVDFGFYGYAFIASELL